MGKKKTDSVGAVVRTVINVSINILILAVVAMLIYNYAGKAYVFGMEIFDDTAIATEENGRAVVVTIPQGASDKKVAKILEREGLVEDANVFYVKLLLSEYRGETIPGTYTLSTSDTPTAIMQKLSRENEEEIKNDN